MEFFVNSGHGSYSVQILRESDAALAGVGVRRAVFVASASTIARAELLARTFPESVVLAPLPDGESAKTLGNVEELLAAFAAEHVSASDVVVAVGGGALTDLVGFVSAIWRRGVPWIVVPTTVACAVDAGIGGKTAVNTAAGKNTAGALWNPDGVVVHCEVFDSLSPALISDGVAEIVKVGCSHTPKLLDVVLSGPGPFPGEWLNTAVELAASVACDVASGRFGPGANRDVLSLGHEVAHALETLSNFSVPHGAAVAVGLRFVHQLAAADTYLVAPSHLDAVLKHCRLPLSAAEAGVDVCWADVRAELAHDKRMAGTLRFLFPGIDGVVWTDALPESDVAKVWESL